MESKLQETVDLFVEQLNTNEYLAAVSTLDKIHRLVRSLAEIKQHFKEIEEIKARQLAQEAAAQETTNGTA